MKKKLKTLMALALAFIFLSCLSYSQTKETGALEGAVTDMEGTPLPGAEVKISSPQMMGTRSLVTDVNGNYRFIGIKPGTYSVDVTLAGFNPKRRENVRLYAGQTLAVDFMLEIGKLEEEVTVISESPLIDVKDSSVNTAQLDREILKDQIFSRDYYPYSVIDLAAGTEGTAAYGGRTRTDNSYLIDGVETAYQSGGYDWSIPDSFVFEEATIKGLGAPAEYDGFKGVVLNLMTKSGGNTFDGMCMFEYQPFGWGATNIDSSRPEYSLYETPPREAQTDIRIGMGGPIIKDKIWFYGSVREQIWQEELAFANSKLVMPKYFAKLSVQFLPSTRLEAMSNFDDFVWKNKFLSPTMPAEACAYELSPARTSNMTLFHSFSVTTFMQIKLGAMTIDEKWGGAAGGDEHNKEVSGHYDASTGMYSGNYPEWSGGKGGRFQINSSLSHHADDFLAGSHDFKFGVEYERVYEHRDYFYNGGYFYIDNVYNYYDRMYHTYAYSYSYDMKPTGHRYSVYAQDSWKVSENITINPGIRLNIYRGHLETRDATLFKTHGFAPRIGLTWDIFGDHSTALKVHYGRIYGKLNLIHFNSASAGTSDWILYEVLPDGTKEELYRESYSIQVDVDPDIKMNSVDQFTLGIERELMKDATVGLTFVLKKWRNTNCLVNVGSRYDLVTFQYLDENGAVQTGQGYEKVSPPSEDKYIITNPEGGLYDSVIKTPSKDYWSLIFSFEKRFSANWMFHASYALSKTKQTALPFYGAGAGGSMPDPNEQLNALWNGEPVGYLYHNLKVYGTVILPFAITVSPRFNFISPGRWTRTVYAPIAGGTAMYVEKPNTNELPWDTSFDIRAEKNIRVKGDFRLGFMVDVYNVFNWGRETSVVTLVNSVNYGKANEFIYGRQFRVALRVYF